MQAKISNQNNRNNSWGNIKKALQFVVKYNVRECFTLNVRFIDLRVSYIVAE